MFRALLTLTTLGLIVASVLSGLVLQKVLPSSEQVDQGWMIVWFGGVCLSCLMSIADQWTFELKKFHWNFARVTSVIFGVGAIAALALGITIHS